MIAIKETGWLRKKDGARSKTTEVLFNCHIYTFRLKNSVEVIIPFLPGMQ